LINTLLPGEYHLHGDHLLALLLKSSAGQLNTLVNFESAILGLDGQFSVGVNTPGAHRLQSSTAVGSWGGSVGGLGEAGLSAV
jgi:hypothetical protein